MKNSEKYQVAIGEIAIKASRFIYNEVDGIGKEMGLDDKEKIELQFRIVELLYETTEDVYFENHRGMTN